MFNKVKIAYAYECNGMLNFQKFKILEQLLCLNSSKHSSTCISKQTGFNQSTLLKESPFHYPIAKKILNNTRKRMVIGNKYFLKKKIKYSCLNSSILKKLVYLDAPHLNSLYTLKESRVSVFVKYTPSI